MKIQFKTTAKKAVLVSIMTSIALTGGAGSTFAQASASPQSYEVQHVEQDTKYSKHVMRVVRESLGVDSKSTQLDSEIETMPKLQVMDRYLVSFGKKVKGNEIRRAVKEIFDIDLDVVSKNDYGSKMSIYPAPIMESLRASFNVAPDSTEQDARIMDLTKNAVMDRYIKERDYSLTGVESRTLINDIFGVNLAGISTLEHMQLGILSKGQWIVKSDTDLFILESSLDDVDVSIYATPYFESLTGSRELPESMVTKLVEMGFTHYEETNLLYYKDPTGGSVPDSFKGQVMGVLIKTIKTEYKK